MRHMGHGVRVLAGALGWALLVGSLDLACGGGGGGTQPPPPGPPVITSFTAGSNAITTGDNTTLTAVFSTGSGTVGIVDKGVGLVTSGAPIGINPVSTTTYTLQVTNSTGGSALATTTVTVVPKAIINSFTASPATITVGSASLLSWSVAGAQTTSISNGVGSVGTSTTATVVPTVTTTYTLTATNSVGTSATMTTKVTVVPPPFITSFVLSPNVPLYPIDTAFLVAQFSGGIGIVDQGVGQILSGIGRSSGAVVSTRIFTLTVTNDAGLFVTAQVAVTVYIGATGPTGPLGMGRAGATATVLPNGRVLIAGGQNGAGVPLSATEIYSRQSGLFTGGGSLTQARVHHTATLMANGNVLLAGGNPLKTADIYDPKTGLFNLIGGMNTGRQYHGAVNLPTGKVLIAGGQDPLLNVSVLTCDLMDPLTSTITPANPMMTPRQDFGMVLLPNGKVLVAGGINNQDTRTVLNAAEIFDPQTGIWSPTGSMNIARQGCALATLTNGKILCAGGVGAGGSSLASTELYDPTSGSWSVSGAMIVDRNQPSATLLPNGKVLVGAGSRVVSGSSSLSPLSSMEIYDPVTGIFGLTPPLSVARYGHSALLLSSGEVLIAGGNTSATGFAVTSAGELYNPLDPTLAAWSPTVASDARADLTLTVLNTGKVLIAGGRTFTAFINGAALYDPITKTYGSIGIMKATRARHTATKLPNGKVLLAGGFDGTNRLATAEIFNPLTNAFTLTGPMGTPRESATATMLANGLVLITGGKTGASTYADTAELYDPLTGTFSPTGSMANIRVGHTATLLGDSKVLVAGGAIATTPTATAEIYNSSTGLFTTTGAMNTGRFNHAAVALPSGDVLIAGGTIGAFGPYLSTAEIYASATGTFLLFGHMFTARTSFTMNLMSNGKVMMAGGTNTNADQASAETFDYLTNQFNPVPSMSVPRYAHAAVTLPSGGLFVFGGLNGINTQNTGDIFR